jgi:hypothetical protein
MGLRGPKPVNVKSLEAEATQWACFFYTLRDGQPGTMQRVEWGPEQSTGAEKWTPVPSRRGRLMLPSNTRYRTSKAIGSVIFIPVSEAARMLPPEMVVRDWCIFPPVMPKPKSWEQLKRARTVSQVKLAATGIGELQATFTSSTSWALNPAGALCRYAEEILAAKRIAHYPRTGRQRSEDKRVVFLAKVMAGLTLGLAPITAVKRLSKWHWPRDWVEKSQQELSEGSQDAYGPAQIEWKGDLWARAERPIEEEKK